MPRFGTIAHVFVACACSPVVRALTFVGKLSSADDNSEPTVCISIAAYESPAWVDLLLANAFAFSESSTRVVLHLDAHNDFSDEDIKRWETSRSTVTNKRIAVAPFQGSVMYAHMLNAKTMRSKWGNTCDYFVLQASNMMWVRSGMEKEVRARRNSPLAPHTVGGGCSLGGDTYGGFTKQLTEPKAVMGWNQPEGSFFPLDDMMGMHYMLNKYLAEKRKDETAIIDAKCYFENVWPSTYMLNYAKLENATTYEKGFTPLCLNSISYGDKEHDSVPLEKMEKVARGDDGYEGYYAVKRVNRDILHSTTKRIAKMSGFHTRANMFRYLPAVEYPHRLSANPVA